MGELNDWRSRPRGPRPDLSERNRKSARHGHYRVGAMSPTWGSWRAMKQRAHSGTCKDAERYLKRGITVCERWLTFENFLADMGERPPGTTLDRIDNAKGYEPGNCRWATPKEQRRNQRCVETLAAFGRSQTIGEWCSEFGISRQALRYRLRAGCSLEEALTLKVDRSNRLRRAR